MTDLIHNPFFPWYEFFAVLSFGFGACIGSFLNVCIYRIPREISVVKPRSFCPHCNKQIPWYHNIPILTYMMLRGKSRCCGKDISFRYFLVETLTALLFLFVWLKFGLEPGSRMFALAPITDCRLIFIYWLAVSGLILGTFVDFEFMIIPDRVTLGGICTGVLLSILVPALHDENRIFMSLLYSLAGTAIGVGILWALAILGKILFRKEAMGFGDVKLLGAIGAFLGSRAIVFTILISSLVGSIVGIIMVISNRKSMQSRIPYGPYLALAALIWILWGNTIWDVYINFLCPPPVYIPDPTIVTPHPYLYIN